MFEFKYFKPLSMTWWASAAPLIAGVFMSMEPVHGLSDWVEVVRLWTGGMTPAMLINLGLFGIGLRGAPGVSGALGRL